MVKKGCKERLQRKACERYQSLSEEEKEKEPQYGRERYRNIPEDEKQSLLSIAKKYQKMRKNEKKRLIIVNHKKLFSFKKSTSILKNNDLENYFDEDQIKAKYQDVFGGRNFEKLTLKL